MYNVKKITKNLKRDRKKVKMSVGESEVAKFLLQNNIAFSREWYFKDFVSNRTKCPLFFDFYLHDFRVVIEFDGPHHSSPVYGKKQFEKTKANDFRKEMYCYKKGIKLLRIPYEKRDDVGSVICKFFDRHGL